jgi:hypothetical protein
MPTAMNLQPIPAQHSQGRLVNLIFGDRTAGDASTALMVSLAKGTLPGRIAPSPSVVAFRSIAVLRYLPPMGRGLLNKPRRRGMYISQPDSI